MTIYENWLRTAYNEDGLSKKEVWDHYIPLEQKIYEDVIGNKIETVEGTVKELATKYNMSAEYICGFLDGLNDATGSTIDLKEIEEDTKVSIKIDFESLFKKMVEYKAEHLYNLPQWNNIYTEEEKQKIYKEQKSSRTVVREQKIGRNEPCPCGSGKKYKQCCL